MVPPSVLHGGPDLVGVGGVGRDRQHVGETALGQGEVDEQAVRRPVHVREQAAVGVARLDVAHQAYRRAGRQQLGGLVAGLLPEAHHRLRRRDRLGGIDPDEAHVLVSTLHPHGDRVAVDAALHRGVGGQHRRWWGGRYGQPRRRARTEHEDGSDRWHGSSHRGLRGDGAFGGDGRDPTTVAWAFAKAWRSVDAVERTIGWRGGQVVVLDQTRLPHEVVEVLWSSLEDAARGIEVMQVRGAPLIGVAAAHGVALALAADPSDASLGAALRRLGATRPTAVNLTWALERCDAELRPLDLRSRAAAARDLARCLADEDVAVCRAIGQHGLELVRAVAGAHPDRPVQVLTHCNAGWLAAVAWGTALAPVYAAQEVGIPVHVWVSETRPRNQGSALTAWELGQQGVAHTVITDNAAGHTLQAGLVDMCLVGADRVAANGDVANKVGTYLKALAALDNGVPFYAVAPTSTVDHATADGDGIPIEERAGAEVTSLAGVALVPEGTAARNWAFDVTPARLVTAIVTERGIVAPGGLGALRG